MGASAGWLWLMFFVPTGIAMGAVGLEFLERVLVSGDARQRRSGDRERPGRLGERAERPPTVR